MDLTPYVSNLRQELAVAAAAGGEDARALAERLTAPLESAARLALLDALSAAAGEITRELAPGSVHVRLDGREPSFVLTLPPDDLAAEPGDPHPPALPLPGPDAEDGAVARINLRLPEQLKGRVEAAADRAGLSVNSWLVRAAAAAVDSAAARPGPVRPGGPPRPPGRPALHRLGPVTPGRRAARPPVTSRSRPGTPGVHLTPPEVSPCHPSPPQRRSPSCSTCRWATSG